MLRNVSFTVRPRLLPRMKSFGPAMRGSLTASDSLTVPDLAPESLLGGLSQIAQERGTALVSVGVSLPEQIVESAEIEERLGLAAGWIERRTGIRSRRIAAPHESLTDHAASAAVAALHRAGVEAADVDLVLFATSTADELMPNAAPLLAHAIGADRAGGFDVGAACTGFLSALAAGSAFIDAGRAEHVLVVGADFMSRLVDPSDRGTAAVFADGAGAILLSATAGGSRVGPVVMGSDGEGGPMIRVPRERQVIEMAGHETFKEAVRRLSESTVSAAVGAGVELDEIDLFVYHQANARILTAVSERLSIEPDRIVDCIGELGNTSAATLPLALAHAHEQGRLVDGSRVLLSAFGAGFTWGATVVEWGNRHE